MEDLKNEIEAAKFNNSINVALEIKNHFLKDIDDEYVISKKD